MWGIRSHHREERTRRGRAWSNCVAGADRRSSAPESNLGSAEEDPEQEAGENELNRRRDTSALVPAAQPVARKELAPAIRWAWFARVADVQRPRRSKLQPPPFELEQVHTVERGVGRLDENVRIEGSEAREVFAAGAALVQGGRRAL